MVHSPDIGSRLDFTNSNAHRKQTIVPAPTDHDSYPAVVSIHLTIIFKAK
jgi:hypothetical protein